MSLPAKKAIEIDENITHYIHKMLNMEMILKYDESKCIECGFCHRVCPVTVSIYDEPLKKQLSVLQKKWVSNPRKRL